MPVGRGKDIHGCAVLELRSELLRTGEVEGELDARMGPLELRSHHSEHVAQRRGSEDHELVLARRLGRPGRLAAEYGRHRGSDAQCDGDKGTKNCASDEVRGHD